MTQLRLVSVRIVDLAKSDHKGVLATYGYGAFEFTVLSANAQATDAPGDLRATIAKAASYGATFINWQEISRVEQYAALDGLKGYDTFWPGGRDKAGNPVGTYKNHNPISYHPDVALFESGDWHFVHKGMAHVTPTKGITEARFSLPSFPLTVVNVHLVAGVDGGGKVPKVWRQNRHALYLKAAADLIAEKSKSGPVITSGDWNTTRLRNLLPLPGAVFDVPASGGTHAGGRLIDWFVRPKSHAEITPEAPMADDRYDKTTHGGKTVDKWTKAALQAAEAKLGYDLTVVQGSYNKGVGASAGTHDGGGVVDLLAWDHVRKVRALREVGFAAWYRPTIKGLWNEHIHAVLIGNEKAADSAKRQVVAYRAHRDGLAGNKADPTWHPNPIPTFAYPPKVAPKPPAAKPPTPKASRFQQMYDTADSIARDKDYSARKRAAAVIIRTAAAPFIKG